MAGIGESAAAGVGNAATSTGAQIGANITGAGNATAAADMAMATGTSGAANNALMAYILGSGLKVGGLGGSGSSSSVS